MHVYYWANDINVSEMGVGITFITRFSFKWVLISYLNTHRENKGLLFR